MLRNWEDWAIGLSVAAAAALALTVNTARAPLLAGDAIAAEHITPQYAMTVTAKRLPAHCKGFAEGAAIPADCAALLNGTTVSVKKNY